ncbi:hypothetical protein C3L33_06207, partial [Rhododendron williamsianum]
MAGGLICDGHGGWVVGFQIKIKAASSSTMVECWALRGGPKLALERNLQGILVEIDSMALVLLLDEKGLDTHELSNILNDCRFLIDLKEEFNMCFGKQIGVPLRLLYFLVAVIRTSSFVVFASDPNCL